MRVDAHHHLWDLKAVHYPWLMARGERRFFGDPAPIQRDYSVSEFANTAVANGIGASVHIQVGADDPMREARWVQEVAEDNPSWPAAQVAFCDLTGRDATANLEALTRLPTVKGIRQIVGRSSEEDFATGTNRLLDDPNFLAGLRKVAELRLSFDLQLIPELMQQTASLLSRVEQLPVALCHCGSPSDWSREGLKSWEQSMLHLARLPQVSCKLSGLGMFNEGWTMDEVRQILETCTELFGADRCMFGSNFPVDSLRSSYEEIVSVVSDVIPAADQEKIFGNNAARFYRL